jgi:hypothetical protein
LHLLRRATYGRTPESEAELRSLGVDAWLDRQLDPAGIDDAACDAIVARFPLSDRQLGAAAVARACWSRRQLFEIMVDFWSNQLDVTRTVIRAHALGRVADLLLDDLAMHPETAGRIATGLCVRFVADEPPAGLAATLATVYLDNRTAIAPVLKALFTSAEFARAADARAKTPLEAIAGTVRMLGLNPDASGTDGIRALHQLVERTGHGPVRWNAYLNLAAGWYPTRLTRTTPLLDRLVPGALPATHGALVETVVRSFTGTAPGPEHTAALTRYFGKKPTDVVTAGDQAVTAQFPHLVALVLDSPMFHA